MHRFQTIPIFVRTAAEGDILVPTHGNFSILYPPRIVAAQDILLPPIVNSSSLDVGGHARITFHEGEVDYIVLPALSNSSELEGGSPLAALVEVTEAPPDEFIRLPTLINDSVLVVGSPSVAAVSVGVAPPPGFIRLPTLVNSSILELGSPAVANVVVSEVSTSEALDDDDEDPMVGGGMVAGRTV